MPLDFGTQSYLTPRPNPPAEWTVDVVVAEDGVKRS